MHKTKINKAAINKRYRNKRKETHVRQEVWFEKSDFETIKKIAKDKGFDKYPMRVVVETMLNSVEFQNKKGE